MVYFGIIQQSCTGTCCVARQQRSPGYLWLCWIGTCCVAPYIPGSRLLQEQLLHTGHQVTCGCAGLTCNHHHHHQITITCNHHESLFQLDFEESSLDSYFWVAVSPTPGNLLAIVRTVDSRGKLEVLRESFTGISKRSPTNCYVTVLSQCQTLCPGWHPPGYSVKLLNIEVLSSLPSEGE
jgi:hypothetical protein